MSRKMSQSEQSVLIIVTAMERVKNYLNEHSTNLHIKIVYKDIKINVHLNGYKIKLKYLYIAKSSSSIQQILK